MSKQLKWRLAAACVIALAVTVPASAQPADEWAQPAANWERNLLAVLVDSDAQGHPVVTLTSDGPLEYESFVLDGPDRLVLDLPDVVSRLADYKFAVEQGGVVQVRASQHQVDPKPVTRVVFDMESPLGYRIDQAGSSLVVVFGDDEPLTTVAVPEEKVEEVVQEMVARLPEPPPPPEKKVEPVMVAEVIPEPEIEEVAEEPSRAVEPDLIDKVLQAPAFAAPAEEAEAPAPAAAKSSLFESKRIVHEETTYEGKKISLNLVDADIKQVFRLFHELSGLNFVLDPDVSGRVTIVLDQVPWTQALDIILKNNGLDKVMDGNVLRIASTQKLAQEAAARQQLKAAEEMEVEPITLTRRLSYARATDIQQVIREGGILSNRGKVIVDERTNTMIISDVPKKVEPLDALITTLDSETPQVIIEARIVETTKSFSQEFGIDWGFGAYADAAHGTSTALDFPHNASMRYDLNLPKGGANVLGFSFGNIVDSFTLDITLDAIEDEGYGRILSSPKIVTQNNERAEIEQGVRIPIVSTTATEINVEFVSASLLLNVTPQITAENTIILDVLVENSSPDFENTAGGIPSIKSQRAQTKVLINDGGTTVIGGIFYVNEGNSEFGVPWFRKLPVFGWLFKQKTVNMENRELLIFITSKIVRLG
jgi:type IV pilus assembly protein PilQ